MTTQENRPVLSNNKSKSNKANVTIENRENPLMLENFIHNINNPAYGPNLINKLYPRLSHKFDVIKKYINRLTLYIFNYLYRLTI